MRTPRIVFAAKSAHSHLIRWLIDWLSKRCLYFFSNVLQKTILDSVFTFCFIRSTISMPIGRLKLAEFGRFVFGKYRFSKCADFEAYPRTQSINQPLNNMGMRRLCSKNGVCRLWGISSWSINQSINHWITWECADFAAKTECADFEAYPRTSIFAYPSLSMTSTVEPVDDASTPIWFSTTAAVDCGSANFPHGTVLFLLFFPFVISCTKRKLQVALVMFWKEPLPLIFTAYLGRWTVGNVIFRGRINSRHNSFFERGITLDRIGHQEKAEISCLFKQQPLTKRSFKTTGKTTPPTFTGVDMNLQSFKSLCHEVLRFKKIPTIFFFFFLLNLRVESFPFMIENG